MSSRRSSFAAIPFVPLVLLSIASFAAAQPRPAVAIRQHATMLRSVWPADFNRDGHVDFVAGEPGPASGTPGRVVVRLGNGGGGVGQPIATGVTGQPAAVGDFNRDALVDVVAVDDAGGLWMLAGRGNGTFQAARALDPMPEFFRFGLAADMNGDGRLDLVVGGGTTVQVRPGRGDLTFGGAVTLPPGSEEAVTAGVAVDLNRDGRRDLVVAQLRRSIIVYLNTGSLIFTGSEEMIEENEEPDAIHGLAAGDLNRDGRVDLVVPHAEGIFDYGYGGVDVLIGRGDGTFAPAARYATGVTGPWTAAIGDFNRDGLADVAVGGRSWSWNDLSDIKSYWDSVAIFPGRGNGLLSRAAVFRLATRVPPQSNAPWVNEHHALRSADVDEDGHQDLVASPLAILLNRPLAPNRPPTVDAGPDFVDPVSQSSIVSLRMFEPDWDWLRVEWRDQNGAIVTRDPSFEYNTLEDRTLTVTVTDDRGATATDTVVIRRDPAYPVFVTVREPAAGQVYGAGAAIRIRWDAYDGPPVHHFAIEISNNAFRYSVGYELASDIPGSDREFTWINAGPPGTWWVRVYAYPENNSGAVAVDTSAGFTIQTTPAGAFPWPWLQHGDLGAVGHAGSAAYASGAFTIRGAGSGVGGTADELHYVESHAFLRARIRRDFSVTARIASLEHVSDRSRAGLMLRETLDPASRHVSLLVSPTATGGVTLEWRAATGGSNARTRVAAFAAPAWVKLVRFFDVNRQAVVIRGFVRKNRTDPWTMVGEQVLSGPELGNVLLVASSGVDAAPASARFDGVAIDEPEFMNSLDLGTTVEGSTVTDLATTTIEGGGANVWGRADAFRYHSTVADLTRGGSATVRVRSLENTHALAKAGLMIRGGYDPGAPHVSLFVTPGGGVRLEYRARLHEQGARFASRAGTAPEWLRLTRSANVFTAFASNDGLTWNRVGAITVALDELTAVGLAVTSHDAGTLATAVFDDLVIRE